MFKDVISLVKYLLSIFLKSKKIGILMYHSVSDGDNRFFAVSENNFEKQLKFLSDKNFSIISADALFDILKNKKEIPEKTICLTFDDGYKNNYSVVFPILKKYNFPMMIFLVTDLIGEDNYLDWDEISEMQNSGLVSFGCHTKSHPDLDKITSLDIERELVESKIILEERFNKKCRFFSYPRGKYDNVVLQKVKEQGFEIALTTKEGIISLKNDMLELPRLSIDKSTTWLQFLGKISGIQFIKGKI